MEVRCSSCATEYEFDDALVSARGTSVKCTNCGHQFRVHPVGSAARAAAETWVVRTTAGKEVTFTSLRDLQQGIVRGELDPKDELSHAGRPYRQLQEIYELQTFFAAARQRQPAPRTLLGVGRDGVAPPRQSTPMSTPPPRRKTDTAPTQERITPVAGMPAVVLPDTVRASMPTPQHGRVPFESGPRPVAPRDESPPPRRVSAERDTDPPKAPGALPWQHLEGLHGEPPSEDFRGGGAGSRWIAALVVLGALALIAGTVGRDYFLGFIRPKAEEPRADARLSALLDQFRAWLAKGELDAAAGELAKARAVTPNDPELALATAQLALTRAELAQLELELTRSLSAADAGGGADQAPPNARKKPETELASEAASKRAEQERHLAATLQGHLADAKPAVAKAAELAPASPGVVRARVDLARLDSQPKAARGLVGPLSAHATDPENAYSLGALDLAEGPQGYPSAVDRLRVAARAEEARGLARSRLIQALIESGELAAARAELDKLVTLAPGHVAITPLRALLDRREHERAAAEEAEKKERERTAARQRPAAPRPSRAAPRESESESADETPIARAARLHRQGDLAGAERTYQGVIASDPDSIPALVGLGDIARQRRATATAAAFYDRVLQRDPNHLGALMARADIHWHSGERSQAAALYRRALGHVGSTDPLGQRALRRIEEFDKGTETETETEPETPAPAPSEGGDDVPITDEAGRVIPPGQSPTNRSGSEDEDEDEDDGETPPETEPSKEPPPGKLTPPPAPPGPSEAEDPRGGSTETP